VPTILVTMNRIKEVLKEKGIKQNWLAEKLGKSYLLIQKISGNLEFSKV